MVSSHEPNQLLQTHKRRAILSKPALTLDCSSLMQSKKTYFHCSFNVRTMCGNHAQANVTSGHPRNIPGSSSPLVDHLWIRIYIVLCLLFCSHSAVLPLQTNKTNIQTCIVVRRLPCLARSHILETDALPFNMADNKLF